MQTWIPRSEYEHLAPAQEGRLRTNHVGASCSGDSQSLLIERTKYGVSCHCFRCGGRGWYSLDRRFVPPAERRGHEQSWLVESDTGIALPGDVAPFTGNASKDANGWFARAGILPGTIEREGFLWSMSKGLLYIPVRQYRYALGPRLAGYVVRGFQPKSYRTLRNGSEALWGLYRGEGCSPLQGVGTDGPLVAVEDVLSAIRVAESGHDALALCGTELAPSAATFALTEGYKRAIIFLDGDNPTVKMKTRTIAKRLGQGGLAVRIVETGSDPKLYPKEELHRLLTES